MTFQPRSVLAPSVSSLSLVQQPENGRHCGDAGPLEHKNERFLAGFVLTPKILQVCWSTESTSCCTKQTLYIYHIQKSIKIIKDIKRHGPMRSNLAHAGYWLVKWTDLSVFQAFSIQHILLNCLMQNQFLFKCPTCRDLNAIFVWFFSTIHNLWAETNLKIPANP